MRGRWFVGAAALFALASLVVCGGASTTSAHAAPTPEAAVQNGFTDTSIGSASEITTVRSLPDGTVVVLTQNGTVRLARSGVLLPTPALTMPPGRLCATVEKGLLGFAISGDFLVDRQVWLYYTATNPAVATGCVNRVSRFTMNGDSIDLASEVILVDNIGAIGGNHNGGDLAIGADGDLFISIGDSGKNPRDPSGPNNQAQDLSLLNGKILRVDRMTGAALPDNPLANVPGAADCRVRGNDPSTPTTPCRELYAWGLRNPFRFAFDPNNGNQTFFVNDVGETTREEVDRGQAGANYGWPIREGVCPQGANPPCAAAPAGSGYTDPLTDYPHPVGTFITAGAFVPNGFWPAAFDGGYLFGDGGSGKIWLRQANGAVDYDAPFATDAGGITDMTFVQEGGGLALYYAVNSTLRRITYAAPAQLASGPLTFRSVGQGTRVYDSRDANGASIAPVRAGTTRYIQLPVNGATTRAALVNLTFVDPRTPGYLTAWAGRTAKPGISNVNGVPDEVVADAGVVPLDASGGFLVSTYSTADLVVDVLGYFDTAPGPVAAGRFAPLAPTRIADTREPASTANRFTRLPATADLPIVRVPVAGRGGMPATGIGAVALSVTAIGQPGAGGVVYASSSGAPYRLSSNINTNPGGDIRANLVVVPLGADGAVDLHLLNIADVVVDVEGWFTDGSQPAGTTGRFVSTALQRMVDTRIPLGFGQLPGGGAAGTVRPPASVPVDALALADNVTLVDTTGPGWVTPYPGGVLPLVSAGNASAAGEIRAVLSFTGLGGPPATISFATYMRTDLVVDVSGYFMR